MSYILPQVQVFQVFKALPVSAIKYLNAFVFGPNYQLFRYSNQVEKELINLGSYNKDVNTEYEYPNLPAGSLVDLNYVKLYLENIKALYATISESAANPVVVVSNTELNKVRAAPIVGAPVNGSGTVNVVMGEAGGTFVGGVNLPEDYVFVPYGGWVSGSWNINGVKVDLSTGSGERAKFLYRSTEGVNGIIDIPADPLTSGTKCIGPDGLMFDLDNDGDSKVRSPLQILFKDSAKTSYFKLVIDPALLTTFAAWDLDDGYPVSVKITVGSANPTSVSWNNTSHLLTIVVNSATTLTQLRTALLSNSDVATYFNISDITGTGTNAVAYAETNGNIDVGGGSEVQLIPDIYRIPISANPYIFATNSASAHSTHFKTRGVRIGDYVEYQFIGSDSVARSGEAKVVGFEADQTLSVVEPAEPKSTNTVSQTGTVDLDVGAAILEYGTDNQRKFNGPDTKVFALSTSNTEYPGELSAGIISDTFEITITTPGVAGVARATVKTLSGSYMRTNVPIETGAYDGRIYVGRNLYVVFSAGGSDPDNVFKVGDVYKFTVKSNFTAVGSSLIASGGSYSGPRNTTYVVEVIRGGVFNRTVNAIAGLQVTNPVVPIPTINWDDWRGGDNDDEYILKCTSAGSLATAVFQATSQRGDNMSGIVFGGPDIQVPVGNNGLKCEFGSSTTFSVGDYWIIKVNACRPQIRIYDTAGVDNGSTVIVNDEVAISLGSYGATLTFSSNSNTEGGFAAGGGLLTGDVFLVDVTASGDGAIKTLVLSDDLPSTVVPSFVDGVPSYAPTKIGLKLYLSQAVNKIGYKRVQSPGDYNWRASETSVLVYKDMQIQDASWTESDGSMPYISVYNADMYLEYRALLTNYSNTIYEISDVNDIETKLGTIHPDNPLAQGVYNALINSGDRSVFYMAVPSDDLTGFAKVLEVAGLTDKVYAFVPLTRDRQILDAVENHINQLSSETNKRWRIGFFGTKMPTEVAIYNKATNPVSDEYFATITKDPATGKYTIVKFYDSAGNPSPYTHVLNDVKVGDVVRIRYATDPWGDSTYESYVVSKLLTQTSLKLASGPSSEITPITKVEVWHNYSVSEIADAVAAVSRSFANRRVYHVFPDALGAYGVQQTAEFGAAAVAGLCSSVPPQQGLTNIELNGFDNIPIVYSTFSRTQLNTMAEAGTLIIMQDIAGGTVYVRHQVSTAASQKDLNTTELSITKNLDSISYFFAERLSGYVGRYNITPDLLEVLKVQISDGLMYLGSRTDVGLLGPQIILDGSSIEKVVQHPVLRDHILAEVNIKLPYPLNVLQLYLVV